MPVLLARYLRPDGALEALARWCPAALVPLSHWPLRWHACLLGLVLTASLTTLLCVDRWQRDSNDRRHRQVQDLQHRLQALGQGAAAPHAPGSPALGDRAALPAMQAELARAAQRHGLALIAMQFDHRRSADAHDAGLQVQIAVQFQGPYPAIKAWLGELTSRYEWLALNSISLRRNEATGDRVEAAITLYAYLQAPR